MCNNSTCIQQQVFKPRAKGYHFDKARLHYAAIDREIAVNRPSTYRASPVAHSHVTLDVKSRRASEPERFHVGENLRLEEAALRPGSTESADQFIIHRTSVLIDQLDSLVAAVMGVTVVHDDVETICEHVNKCSNLHFESVVSTDLYLLRRHFH